MPKKPNPRDFGLDSDQPLAMVAYTGADPEQPYTQEELHAALDRLLFAEALAERRRLYNHARDAYDYSNSWR